MLEASSITALLGPTNTGKTHRAVERMLQHASGMIGLPLRLLAREVYDKLVARVGADRVALVTGEEKRAPRRADYWVATVEAMPVTRDVDFVAIDEIQLAEHDGRGHTFTARLLDARGRKETYFLGSSSMSGVLSTLAPTARQETTARLSRLRYVGATELRDLPPRSAVVAFSAARVYELAERLRARRGGAAVVMGALSPRTRNAQVEMFQSGEVDYLVATDAIGMGLNLDVAHVSLAARQKFDGGKLRELTDAELAQIAGRAGRHVSEGTFGVLPPAFLSPEAALGIELGHVRPVRAAWYRSAQLDTSSLTSLRASLREPPRRAGLRLVPPPVDEQALELLARRADVARLASGSGAVGRLWEACKIPDFRAAGADSHAALVAEVFLENEARGGLSDAWLDARVARLDDEGGSLDDLLDRLAAVRTFTFLSNREGWAASPDLWRERTAAIEDRLSDALHARLVERFVERQSKRRGGRARARRGVDPSHPFARLAARADGPPAAPDAPLHERALDAALDELELEADGLITLHGEPLGRLTRGPRPSRPDVAPRVHDGVSADTTARLSRKLAAFARALAREVLGPLGQVGDDVPASTRALAHALEASLGSAPRREVARVVEQLEPAERERLEREGLVFGRASVHAASSVAPRALGVRAVLATVALGLSRPLIIDLDRPVVSPSIDAPSAAWRLAGHLDVGALAVRADALELALLEAPRAAAARLSVSGPELRSLWRAMSLEHELDGPAGP